MSYQVLARKWRPISFQAMVGQEHILRMLTNALEHQRLHHAYLFTGTRGVGKTTLARLLAKCLNCESGVTSTPCNNCSSCTAINGGRFLDLIEVDAASRTKVEDTRELLDNVQYAPTQGRYKIYLIDEVHMLSGHSFNALLKTLEEPPAHVKFLLATTDPKRLPITILSRCLQFNLKRVPIEQITLHLEHICQAEKINFEQAALIQLAKAADGSIRDALSLLDQAIAFCNSNLNDADIQRMLGNVEQACLFRLLDALAEQNGQTLLQEIHLLAEHAPDFEQVLESLLTLLHQIAVTQIVGEKTEYHPAIIELAKRVSPEAIQLYYQIALHGRRDLTLAPHPLYGFEMTLIRMLAFTPSDITANSIPKQATTIALQSQASNLNDASNKPKPIANQPPLGPDTNWTTILPLLNLSGLAYELAANCSLKGVDNGTAELLLSKKHQPMLTKKLVERLEEAISHYYQNPTRIKITFTEEELDTAAKQQEQTKIARQQDAIEAINQDSQVQKLISTFNATLDPGSIKPRE